MSDEIRVLAIDDDEAILIVLRKTLEADHYVADTVTSAREALEKLRQCRYDAVLCDMWLPGMNGKEFYEYLEREFPGTQKKVIFMTADVASEATWDFIDGQGLPYIIKPFARKLLMERLTDVIGRKPVVLPPAVPEEWDGQERRLRRRIVTKSQVKVDLRSSGGNTQIATMIDATLKGVSFLSTRKYDVGTELVVCYPYPNVSSLPQNGTVVKAERTDKGFWRIAVKL